MSDDREERRVEILVYLNDMRRGASPWERAEEMLRGAKAARK